MAAYSGHDPVFKVVLEYATIRNDLDLSATCILHRQ